jgi:hypothetical protein
MHRSFFSINFFFLVGSPSAGPNWANYSLSVGCLLWAVFWENFGFSAKFCDTFFHGASYVSIIFDTKWDVL